MIYSPITNKPAIKLYSIEVKKIIEEYKKVFQLDVSKYFSDIKFIDIYRCNETGYEFYYPAIEGDSLFYEYLQQYDWYYMPWKWEHKIANQIIKTNTNVLEVGCGKGDFLKRIKEEKKANVTGLELNESVVNKQGVKILNETIQKHAINNKEKYDVVCSFQVLEHIADVKSFINAQIETLKPGGKLIISVPNNNSFIRHGFNILNMPPHHVGLWNKRALTSLQKYFPLKLESVLFEPLQDYHYLWYINIQEERLRKSNSFIYKVYYKARLSKLFRFLVRNYADKIHGHTILTTYSKEFA